MQKKREGVGWWGWMVLFVAVAAALTIPPPDSGAAGELRRSEVVKVKVVEVDYLQELWND